MNTHSSFAANAEDGGAVVGFEVPVEKPGTAAEG